MNEPSPKANPPKPGDEPPGSRFRNPMSWFLFLGLALILLNVFQATPEDAMPFSEFKARLAKGDYDRVILHENGRIEAWPRGSTGPLPEIHTLPDGDALRSSFTNELEQLTNKTLPDGATKVL
ncbi:MAG: hypothetical protein AB7F75_10465, partial [Planctomycetota bacterium]